MHDPESSERLASFADVLAEELPGTWSSAHLASEHKEQIAQLADRIWDMNLAAESLAQGPLQRAAVLSRPDGAQLAVLDQPQRDGFLIAAVAPRGLPAEAFRGIREPDGIALTSDPFHSAQLVDGDLLPRYDAALHQVRCNAAGIQPSQPERVVLTWQPDGSLAAAPACETAAAVLSDNGFLPDQTGVYRLDGDDTTVQARAVRETGRQLATHGITTALQHPASHTAPTAAPAAPSPVRSSARTPTTRAR